MNNDNERFMRRAVELSMRGYPAPNPRVGCVIVSHGRIVGEGWHDHAGGDHAEIVALNAAGKGAVGAQVFCTLEPCDHHGRTPPCSRALVRAGVASVTFAVKDPNPVAQGGGKTIENAGIHVESGLLEDEARRANAVFMTAFEQRRPYIVCKSAQTADGFIARDDGKSQWITGEESRKQGHRLRAELGCVLVGRKTVEMDDPMLTARIEGVVNQPLRAVIDPQARLGTHHKVFADKGSVVRFVKPGAAREFFDVSVPSSRSGLDLQAILDHLHGMGVIGVLVEGGGETVAAFIRAGLVDRLEIFIAPTKFGKGRRWLGQRAPKLEFKLTEETMLGEDVWRTYAPLTGSKTSDGADRLP